MTYIYVLGIFCLLAYLLQSFLGFQQIKHFTKEYQSLKALGRVAIGRRAGKFKSGTIVMFALDKEGNILAGRKIQGTTILAKFKPMKGFHGLHIESLTQDLEVVKKENKLTQLTILDAVNIYQQVKAGKVIPQKAAPIFHVGIQLKYMKNKIFKKYRKGSV